MKFGNMVVNFDRQRIPLSSRQRENRRGTYRYYGAQGVIDSVDDYLFDGQYLLVAEDGENLLSRKQPIAQLVEGQFWVNNHAHILQSNEYSDIRYLYYVLNSIDISAYVTGSAQPKLSQASLNEIEIDLPSLPIQKAIAETLGTLDDKIENNKKINHHLEQMAQAIFKTWFVDFEPWGGVMPDDWRKIQLAEIVETVNGYTYKSSELVDSTTAMATIKNFERGGGFKLEGFKEILPSSKIKPSQYVNLYETIVAHTDLTQKAEVIGNAEMLLSKAGYELIVASMDLVKVLPATEGLSKFVLGAILKSPLFKEHCLGYTNGTTVLHLSKRAIPEFLLYFPQNIEILNTLNDLLEPLYLQMSLNIDESARLVLLRDTLLHRLMSGELSVAELGGAK